MSTLILLFSLITQGSSPATPVDAGVQAEKSHMRYHGVEMLLAKFQAEAALGADPS